MTLFFPLLALAISIAAMIYGLPKLYSPSGSEPRPLYFQMYFWALCCYLIATLSDVVIFVCNGYENSIVTVGLIGHFGVYWSLLTANCSQIDTVVDDRISQEAKTARRIAIIAPVLSTLCLYIIFREWSSVHIFYGIAPVLSLLPVIPASYFNLKHLLLPTDDLKLLEGTRLCNIFALAFYAFRITYYMVLPNVRIELSSVIFFCCAVMMAGITFSTVKGVRRWSF